MNNDFVVPHVAVPPMLVSPDAVLVAEDDAKARTVQFCLNIVYTATNLAYSVPSLLQLWTECDDDEVDMATNHVGNKIRPVRQCILKTLLQYPNQAELEFFINTQQHPALRALDQAKKAMHMFDHVFHYFTFDYPVRCCEMKAPSMTGHKCISCHVIMCGDCASPFCADDLHLLLDECINHPFEEDSENGSESSSDESEDSEDENEETRLRRGAKYGPPEEEQPMEVEAVDEDCQDQNGVYNIVFTNV